jgi:hypothetical protein
MHDFSLPIGKHHFQTLILSATMQFNGLMYISEAARHFFIEWWKCLESLTCFAIEMFQKKYQLINNRTQMRMNIIQSLKKILPSSAFLQVRQTSQDDR